MTDLVNNAGDETADPPIPQGLSEQFDAKITAFEEEMKTNDLDNDDPTDSVIQALETY